MEKEKFQKIISRLQAKDSKALQELYEEFFEKIYASARYEIRNRDDAYDIAMEVILKLCDFHGDAELIRKPAAYIMAVTQYTIKDFFRRKKWTAETDIFTLKQGTELRDELWINDILGLLTEDEKDIFLKHAIWGEKLKDIASDSGKAYITIKRQYSSIKEKLKRFYF